MKHVGYIFLSIVIFLMASCTQKVKRAEMVSAPEIPSDWLLLEEDSYLICYPPGWDLRKDVPDALFCLLSGQSSPEDLFRDNVNLVMESLPEEMTTDRYVGLSIKKMGNKYKVTEEKKYVINGQEYYHLDLTGDDNLCLNMNVFMKNKRAYILTFTYESKESGKIKNEGDKIIKSFRIK